MYVRDLIPQNWPREIRLLTNVFCTSVWILKLGCSFVFFNVKFQNDASGVLSDMTFCQAGSVSKMFIPSCCCVRVV